MKTAIIAAAMAAGLTAIPATAQDWNHRDRDYRGDREYSGNICEGVRAEQLYGQIRHEVRQRDLSWREARDLRAQVDRTAAWERTSCARGMNTYQASRLDRQYDRLADMIRREARG